MGARASDAADRRDAPLSPTHAFASPYARPRSPWRAAARHALVPAAVLTLAAVLAGCGGSNLYQIHFMPPPAFLEAGEVPAFAAEAEADATGDPRILYATVREPASVEGEDRFYSDERAGELRIGIGRVVLGTESITWDQVRSMALLQKHGERYPLQVADVVEFGVLDRTLHPILHKRDTLTPDAGPRRAFTAAVDARLARSRDKDVFLYVHGYRVNFENPLLVAAELWHFLGYQGVFIPFAWPSHRERLAYFGDTESARYSAVFLREFIEYLATETEAERIHIVGYSAGTRLVISALHQVALSHELLGAEAARRRLRIGNVLLVGSDVDRGVFGTYLLDGLLGVPEHLTIYESPKDKALGMAFLSFRNERLGQLDPSDLTSAARDYLLRSDALALVSVESAPGFDHGNGHSYFRDSPWVSTDLLATLRYGFRPAERGLVQDPETGIWSFPADYLTRIEAKIDAVDPERERASTIGRLAQPIPRAP
ncbi:MAG: alpha/beta hydrolase [Myxococcota bacterium]